MKHEGGWSLDPDDPGGETLNGVTRRNWGWMPMWDVVDRNKKKHGGFKEALLDDGDKLIISHDVRLAFEHGYWARARCDDIPNQSLADQLVDTAYHTGVHQAVKFLQRGLNVLNRVGTLYRNISVDGGVGDIQTLPALRRCLEVGRGRQLHFLHQSYRAEFYTELMEASEKKEKYLGWFIRAASWEYSDETSSYRPANS